MTQATTHRNDNNVTDYEAEVLLSLLTNHFLSGYSVADWIWSDCIGESDSGCAVPTRSLGGVVSSLVKKGLVETDGNVGREACVRLTPGGVDVAEDLRFRLEAPKVADPAAEAPEQTITAEELYGDLDAPAAAPGHRITLDEPAASGPVETVETLKAALGDAAQALSLALGEIAALKDGACEAIVALHTEEAKHRGTQDHLAAALKRIEALIFDRNTLGRERDDLRQIANVWKAKAEKLERKLAEADVEISTLLNENQDLRDGDR